MSNSKEVNISAEATMSSSPDMDPKDKWKVAVAQAPRIAEKTPTTSGGSTSEAPATTPPLSSHGTKRPAAGEEASLIDAVMEIKVSSGGVDGEETWGETHSHQAVEELQQWLLQSTDLRTLLPRHMNESVALSPHPLPRLNQGSR